MTPLTGCQTLKRRDTFQFPWRWHPVATGVFVLLIDFGLVMLIRGFWEHDWYWSRWTSFYLGDSVFLPPYAVCAGYVIQKRTHDATVKSQCVLLLIGILIWDGVEALHVIFEPEYREVARQPSQIWHTVIAGPMFLWMMWGLLTMWRYRVLAWQHLVKRVLFIMALVLILAGYGGTQVYDNFVNPHRAEPVTVSHR